jgi:hypothetical protein
MMGDRGITWACSRCGARFSKREDLTAHVAATHKGQASTNAPRHDLVEPSVPAVPSETSAREPRQPDADLARQSEPAATAVAAGEKPTAPPTLQPPRRVPTSAHRTLRWVALAAVCAVAAGLSIAFPHQIAHQIDLAVTRQPTPFTELYFSDPQTLPASLSLSAPNVFGFTVVNHEGHDTVYSYVVTLASSHGASTIAQGRIDLRNNMRATRLVNVRPTRRATEYLTTVNLLGRTEMIRFRGVSQ